MPEIKLQHIVSFSSEDKTCPAENLLKPEGFGKWACAQTGTKQASVVVQFEKSSKIHQIDIGNAHSAFVEVLVGRSSQASEDDYQVVLVASSFMSPLESRNSSNPNRVRIFDVDKLSKATTEEKWDRAKIVCSQPFNKNTTYGISFIKFHSPPDESTPKTNETKLGGFKMKAEEKDDISPGSLFLNRHIKEKTSPAAPLTGAAAARAASRLADEACGLKKEPESMTTTPGKRKHGENTNLSSNKPSPQDKEPEKKAATSVAVSKKSTSLSGGSSDTIPGSSASASKPSTSHKKESTQPPPKKKHKPDKRPGDSSDFSHLMKGVVFVLSGFQNPRRGDIRDKALAMGAQYKSDWGKGCTHLVCAFANTPKFQQVKGKGKIVAKEWIEESHKQRKLLPWKRYRMGDDESSTDSEGDTDAKPSPQKREASPCHRRDEPSRSATPQKKKSPVKVEEDEDATDVDSGGDTEDEIKRVREQNANKNAANKNGDDDPYAGSTDVDDISDDDDLEIPELPNFFKGKHFLLYGEFSAEARKQAKRFIIAFNGVLEEYMGDNVTYVVTASEWDSQFDQALSDNGDLIFVRPRWLEECCEQNKLVPYQRYMVVPK